MGGFGIWELLIILLIVALLFGTKKLRSIGGDLGGAVKGFRGAMKDADEEPLKDESDTSSESDVLEGEVEKPSEKSSPQ